MGVIGTAWLVDAVTGAPSYTGRLNRQNTSVFLAGATAARPFGAISGVRPGTSVATITATSTTWTAQTFAGGIDGQASALAGPYNFAFNLVTSGAVTASNASNPRIDTLAVQISDPAEGDGTSNPLVTLVYTTGVAAAVPAVPAAPARSFIVAQLQFPAGAGTTPTVTWVAPYTVAAGGILPVPTTVYPASPYLGQYVDDAALGLLRWNGSTWQSLSSSAVMRPTTATNGTIGATGSVTSGSVALVRPNGVFTAAFTRYEVKFDITTATSTTVNALLSTVGVDAATGYDNERLSIVSSAATPAQSLNTTAIITGGGVASTRHVGSIFFDTNPAVANDTYFRVWATISPNPMTVAHGSYLGGGLHRATTAFDGISFAASSGNLTMNYLSVIGSY